MEIIQISNSYFQLTDAWKTKKDDKYVLSDMKVEAEAMRRLEWDKRFKNSASSWINAKEFPNLINLLNRFSWT